MKDLSRAARDLLLIVGVVVAVFIASAHFKFSEHYNAFSLTHDDLEMDEWPVVLLALALCLIWFSWRRSREARSSHQTTLQLLETNRSLNRQLMEVQENEREFISRELHDEMGQGCTAIRAEAQFIRNASEKPEVHESAQRIIAAAGHLYDLAKNLIHRLRPYGLDTAGLVMTLQEYCENWEKQTRISCLFFPSQIPESLDRFQALALYRLVQEGLNNVAKHAAASRVKILLQHQAGSIMLLLEDDGVGLGEISGKGLGLQGMSERVKSLGGTIEIGLGESGGVRISASIPLQELP
jgi:two-component system sensor histidine kinase UhpB